MKLNGTHTHQTLNTPSDFSLWGYLKDNIYENNLQSIPELERIVTAKIKLEECVRVMFMCACNAVVVHLEHISERA